MRQYLLRYSLDSTIELGQPLEFNMPNNLTIAVRDQILRDEGGLPTHYAFTIDAQCPAESAEKAIEVATPMVEGIATVISFSLSAAVGDCVLEKILDSTPDVAERDLIQHIPLTQSRIRPARKLRPEAFKILWEYLNKLQPEHGRRVHRAMHWYRKSIFEEDDLDQFVNLWTGLEVINHLVKMKHDLPEKSIRKCPHCDKDVVTPHTSAGIKYLLPDEAWSRASNTRKALLHGFGNLQDLIGEAHLLIPVLRTTLLKGILDLLEIPKEKQGQLIREPLRKVQRPSARAHVTVKDLKIEDVYSGKADPYLEVEQSDLRTWVDEGGSKHERSEMSLRLTGHEGTWSPKSIEVEVKKDPEDDSAELEVII